MIAFKQGVKEQRVEKLVIALVILLREHHQQSFLYWHCQAALFSKKIPLNYLGKVGGHAMSLPCTSRCCMLLTQQKPCA